MERCGLDFSPFGQEDPRPLLSSSLQIPHAQRAGDIHNSTGPTNRNRSSRAAGDALCSRAEVRVHSNAFQDRAIQARKNPLGRGSESPERALRSPLGAHQVDAAGAACNLSGASPPSRSGLNALRRVSPTLLRTTQLRRTFPTDLWPT